MVSAQQTVTFPRKSFCADNWQTQRKKNIKQYDCSKLDKEKCDKDVLCKWNPQSSVTKTDVGLPGLGPKTLPPIQKGSLTKLFNQAGINASEKGLTKLMTEENCQKLGNWMFNNVKSWNTPGKNPKQQSNGYFFLLERYNKNSNPILVEKLEFCRSFVKKALDPLPETPRK